MLRSERIWLIVLLISEGVNENEANKVKSCITSHRFRSNHLLDSIEAKILFDADTNESFLKEYNFKLKNLYDRLYTKRGREIAESRRDIAIKFYESLRNEIMDSHRPLKDILERE